MTLASFTHETACRRRASGLLINLSIDDLSSNVTHEL